MKQIKVLIVFAVVLFIKVSVIAQVDTALESKAAGWVASLQLNDNAKAERVKSAIVIHLTAVKDWHNSHSFTLVPEGINPANGNKLSELDRDIIICSTKPKSIHENLMAVLKTELDSVQVETILDKYTVGKVEFTLKGYKAIVPDLTAKEETEILKNLKQAREQAIDYKNMKEISAIFEIYKTKCEQYLNNNGRSWRQLYKAYTDKVKAEKAAAKSQQ
jgi:ribosomal protein S24E